ncbi:MAG: tetratricopeptide repeat protein [Flavobacteriia bacterium]|nr:tetratricopeptide repeat protein [Flavobacteriia bacterium]
MKIGPIIAIVVAAGLTAFLVFSDTSLSEEEANEKRMEVEHAGHDHEEQGEEEVSDLDAKVAEAVEIIETGSKPPMVAIQMLLEVVEEDPEHIGALMVLGDFSVMSGQYEKAEGRYQTILALEPNNDVALNKLIGVYTSTNKEDEAKSAIQGFLEKNKNHPRSEEYRKLLESLGEQ